MPLIGTTAHTVKKFDEELATLRDLVLRMGGLVEDQLHRAIVALESGDGDAAAAVVAGDREIDRIELRADEEIAQMLALRSPLGIDLRTVLTLSKTVNDLERAGDEAKKVARVALRAAESGGQRIPVGVRPLLAAVGRQAIELLNGALDALVRLDLDRADAVMAQDDALDAAFDAAVAAIAEAMEQEPAGIAHDVQLLFAAKGLERVGDHAKNIAQYVFYLVEGRDVRHPKVNPAA